MELYKNKGFRAYIGVVTHYNLGVDVRQNR